MADDGTKFAWDDEEEDWKEVEGEEEDELEEADEEGAEVCFPSLTGSARHTPPILLSASAESTQ